MLEKLYAKKKTIPAKVSSAAKVLNSAAVSLLPQWWNGKQQWVSS